MDIGLSIMIRCLASECPRPQRAGQFDGRAMMAGTTNHKVLSVGGGAAGITVAASLKRHGPGGIDIAIVEPSDTHYYQPAFTLVGAGVYDLARTRRTTESLVPSGVKRIKAVKPGSKAVFTQPPLPFKCPGAPQKIVYLTADYLQRGGIRTNVDLKYFVHASVIFGVPFFSRECAKVAERYGVKVHYQHNLVTVDAKAKTALFEIVGGDSQGQRISVPYDMLHVSPPQSPPDDISSSPLANAAGWVEVDQNSMQHVRHANVFALGDVTAPPNSKTAAAVRKQAPVVVRNILKLMNGQSIDGGYDGYASCPLTTANGKAIIAEFIYGGKVTPTLPILNPGKERWLGWWIKASFLPIMYWQYMLKGYEWFPKHNTAFKEPTVG